MATVEEPAGGGNERPDPYAAQHITGADQRTPPLTAHAYARLLMYPDTCRQHEMPDLLVRGDSHGACWVPVGLANEVLELVRVAGYHSLYVARDWEHHMARLAAWKPNADDDPPRQPRSACG